MSAEHSPWDPRLQTWLEVVSYYWQRRGVSDEDGARLRTDLERDLRSALADGATVDALVGEDPSDFARELAEADGLGATSLRPDHSMTTPSLLLTALIGMLVGAVASALLWYPAGLRLLEGLSLSNSVQVAFAVGLHVVAACICTVFAMAAVRWRFRFHGEIRRITIFTGVSLLLGGATSVAPTMAVAAILDYSSAATVVLLEVGIVLAFCVAGLRTAQWILTREIGQRASA